MEELYMYGKGQKGRGGGGIHLLGDGPAVGVAAEGGISLNISLDRKAARLCNPFSRGCTEPCKGRERGRRITLG